MEKFKTYLILALALIIMVLCLLHCNPADPIYIKGETKTERIVEIDTFYTEKPKVEGTWTAPKAPVDSMPVDGLSTESVCKMHRTYADSIVDSNQVIYYTIKTTGILDSAKINYKLKIPVLIRETITNNISRTDTVLKSPRVSLYTGVELSGNQHSFNASPFVFLTKDRMCYKVGYGLVDKSVQVGIGYRIFKSKR